MIYGISIHWYEMTCGNTTAINTIPIDKWIVVIKDPIRKGEQHE